MGGQGRDKSGHWAGQGRATGQGTGVSPHPGEQDRTEGWPVLPLIPPQTRTGGWTGDTGGGGRVRAGSLSPGSRQESRSSFSWLGEKFLL